MDTIFDVIVVGSGFGGSVAAMRLAQKGHKVAVLEMGKKYEADDFPKTNWNIRKFFWLPLLRCFGIQKITWLKGLMLFHGVGVGGGSLVYANTLMKPLDPVFKDSGWPDGFSWKQELDSHYKMASNMLGVATNPFVFEGEEALRVVGEKLGVASSFHPTDVGVYFGKQDLKTDPYFLGQGPQRMGCNYCGGCLIGCRYLAKNTLDLNYLYFAQKWGVQIFPEIKVVKIIPDSKRSGYWLETQRSTSFLRKKGPRFFAKKVILSAGVLGNLEILLKNRDVYKTLPQLSKRLGETVRTNGESLVGATSFDLQKDLSKGIAIGAAIHPNDKIKIENVRYPSGSGAMRFFAVPLISSQRQWLRPLKLLGSMIFYFWKTLRFFLIKDWAKSTVILLVMQNLDQKLSMKLGRFLFWPWKKILKSEVGNVPCYFPIAQEAANILAQEIKGAPLNVLQEVAFSTPATAHILGGCCMGQDKESGVVDSSHEVFGAPGLYVCDGSVVPVNLAVNPSLTIVAMAERFASLWPLASNFSQDSFEKRQIHFGMEKK